MNFLENARQGLKELKDAWESNRKEKTPEEKTELIRQLRAEALRRTQKLEALIAKMRKEGISENIIAETAAKYSGNEY